MKVVDVGVAEDEDPEALEIQSLAEQYQQARARRRPRASSTSLDELQRANIQQEDAASSGHALVSAYHIDALNNPGGAARVLHSKRPDIAAHGMMRAAAAPRVWRKYTEPRVLSEIDTRSLHGPMYKLGKHSPRHEKKDPLAGFLKNGDV